MIKYLEYSDKNMISCLLETKCNNADIENVQKEFASLGFQILIQNRHDLTNWRSGGGVVAIKDGLFKYCKPFYCKNDFIIIIKQIRVCLILANILYYLLYIYLHM